jgi:CheY-like chemotaxis protein
MSKKILYLDDEPDQIYTLKALFSDYEEFELTATTSVDECFQILDDNHQPDLILLDIMMTEISGWEVFDRIKSNPSWSHIPIVFLTARTDDLAGDAGRVLGEGYVEKPFEIDKIIACLHEIFNDIKPSNDGACP